jgi:hypothetical protein
MINWFHRLFLAIVPIHLCVHGNWTRERKERSLNRRQISSGKQRVAKVNFDFSLPLMDLEMIRDAKKNVLILLGISQLS